MENMVATSMDSGIIAQVPHPVFDHPLLAKKYVVLHSGVGPNWKRGDVVQGNAFFTDDRNIVQTMVKKLNPATGHFEHVIKEERRMNEVERVAGMHRLLTLGAVREATQEEAKHEHLELEKPVSTALVGSNEEKIAQQQSDIDALKGQIAELLNRNVIANAITETKAAVQVGQPVMTPTGLMVQETAPSPSMAGHVTTEKTASGVSIQPPPGGKPSPARGGK